MPKLSAHPFLLVKPDATYNPQEIMRAAWAEVRRPNRLFPGTPAMTIRDALLFVWNVARQQRDTVLLTLGRASVSVVQSAPGEYADTFEQWGRDQREAA